MRTFLLRHYYSIDVLFLMIYSVLQLILVLVVFFSKEYTELIVSVFIVTFIFFTALERTVLHFKSSQSKEDKNSIEIQYYELLLENESLRKKNKESLGYIRILRDLIKDFNADRRNTRRHR